MFRCTQRFQERLQNGFAYIGEFKLVKIAQAIIRSQTAIKLRQGLESGLYNVSHVLSSTLAISHEKESKSESTEEGSILKDSIVTNTVYYAGPIIVSLGVRYALNNIPFVAGSSLEGFISNAITMASVGLCARRTVGNALSVANLTRSHSDRIIRESALGKFDKILPNVCSTLSRSFARSGCADELSRLMFTELNGVLRKYFSDPDLFRNIIYKNLALTAISETADVFPKILEKDFSAISPLHVASPLADILVKIIFSKLLSDFQCSENFLSSLTKIFDSVALFNSHDLAQDTINQVNFYGTDTLELQLLEPKCDCAPDPDLDNEQKCIADPPVAPFLLNVLRTLSELMFIGLVKKYSSLGSELALVLTAQMYGRNLLDLQLGNRCLDRRMEILSANKSLAIGLGLPVAGLELLALKASGSFYVGDAVGNMLLHLWTLAELKNKSKIKTNSRGGDLFFIPTLIRDLLHAIITSISLKRSPPKRTIAKIKKITRSPGFHWAIAGLLGDWRKLPRPRFVPKTFDALLEHGISRKLITVRQHPDAINVLLKQVPAIQDFLKLYGNDVAYAIKKIRQVRAYQPWRITPLLSFWHQGALVGVITVFLHLLKEQDLFRLLNFIHAAIENTKKASLVDGEQKAVMISGTSIEDDTDYFSRMADDPDTSAVMEASFKTAIDQAVSSSSSSDSKEIKESVVEPIVRPAIKAEERKAVAPVLSSNSVAAAGLTPTEREWLMSTPMRLSNNSHTLFGVQPPEKQPAILKTDLSPTSLVSTLEGAICDDLALKTREKKADAPLMDADDFVEIAPVSGLKSRNKKGSHTPSLWGVVKGAGRLLGVIPPSKPSTNRL